MDLAEDRGEVTLRSELAIAERNARGRVQQVYYEVRIEGESNQFGELIDEIDRDFGTAQTDSD